MAPPTCPSLALRGPSPAPSRPYPLPRRGLGFVPIVLLLEVHFRRQAQPRPIDPGASGALSPGELPAGHCNTGSI